jgi:hypothetical protein
MPQARAFTSADLPSTRGPSSSTFPDATQREWRY